MLQLHKMYIDSINKLINLLISLEYSHPYNVKLLLNSLDHGLFSWGQMIDNSSQEISKKALEEYLRQILLTAISKTLYYKRICSPLASIEVLESSHKLLLELLSSKRSTTLHICAKFTLCLGLIYLESSETKKALEAFLEAIKILNSELKILISPIGHFIRVASCKPLYKLRRNLIFLNLSIYNMALAYLIDQRYKEVLNCYEMCKWCFRIEREIFAKTNMNEVQRFIIESILVEESSIVANVEVERPDPYNTITRNFSLEKEDIMNSIDRLWGLDPEAKEQYDRLKKKNFNEILISSQGLSITSEKHISTPNTFATQTHPASARPSIGKPDDFFITATEESGSKKIKKKNTVIKRDKMLNPDEYFKARIYRSMKLNTEWVEEPDKKKRFKQDLVKQIINTEKHSGKSLNMLKEFLITKSRDKISKESQSTDLRVLKKEAYYDIGYKIHTLQHDLQKDMNNVEKVEKNNNCKNSTCTKTKPTRRKVTGNNLLLPLNEEQKKEKITRAAEDLQKEITTLEESLKSSKKVDKKKKDDVTSIKPYMDEHQNLAKSIINRGIEASPPKKFTKKPIKRNLLKLHYAGNN